jgi:hypothetical protein
MKDTLTNRLTVFGNILLMQASCMIFGATFDISSLRINEWPRVLVFVIYFISFFRIGQIIENTYEKEEQVSD